jgi:hypothetical protein
LSVLALEQLEEVTDELKKVIAEDPEFHKEIRQHPLNLDVFLASPDAGEAARSSFQQGYAKGTVRHG